MQIRAECHSDDRAVEVPFDAYPWFAQASDNDIRALAACDWGGDYPADDVAEFAAGSNSDVQELFSYLGFRKSEPCGFECNVNSQDALGFLRAARPFLHDELVNKYGPAIG